jgi:outer membrane protein assembly factor BamE
VHKGELYAGKVFGIHKLDIPQGNVIANENIKKIKYGMTKSQVIYILGTPVLNSFFDNNKLMYIAFTQDPYSDPQHENLILEFKNNSLVKMTRENFSK